MVKRILIKAAVLIPIFIAALLFFNRKFYNEEEFEILQMEKPTFPTLSFSLGDCEINNIVGYAQQMDIPSVRDTIVPTDGRHTLSVYLHVYDNLIESAEYTIYDVSGKEVLETNVLDLKSDGNNTMEADIQFNDSWKDQREAVMETVVKRTDKDPVYFYTRITRTAGVNAEGAVNFCKRFSSLSRTPEEEETVKAYLETNGSADNGTFQYVDMHCSLDQVMWKGLEFDNVSEYRVRITECNEVYLNLELSYSMDICGKSYDEELKKDHTDTYDVTEFYRVRTGFSHYYILNYERRMNVRYEDKKQFLTMSGLDLGITDPKSVDLAVNETGTIVSYVTGNALWEYDVTDNILNKVFSFRTKSDNDERDLYPAHKIKILDMDEEGNISFLVSGYMNSGTCEGLTGTAVYYYDSNERLVNRLAYLPGKESGERTIYNTSQMLFFDQEKDVLYAIVDGELRNFKISTGESDTIVAGLDKLLYAVSEDGKILAYFEDESLRKIQVMNLETGKKKRISASKGDTLMILGFIGDGLMVGFGKESDTGYDVLGNEIRPATKIRILDESGIVIKEYDSGSNYVLSASVSSNFAEVNLGVRNDNVYVEQGKDYISMTSGEAENDERILVETYQNGDFERCVRISVNLGLDPSKPTKRTAEIIVRGSQNRIESQSMDAGRYYVYAGTHLDGIYDSAGSAVVRADKIFGVVVTEDGRYLWERGNRDLAYSIENEESIVIPAGVTEEGSLAACGQMLIDYLAIPGNVADETAEVGIAEALEKIVGKENCIEISAVSYDELYYIINRNQPVIAFTGKNTAVLMTGYDENGAKIIDPVSGQAGQISNEELSARFEAGGNHYLTVLKQ